MKNTNAINKIIAELSLRDYKARCKRLTKKQIDNIKTGRKTLSDYGGYSLAQDTMDAVEIKRQYVSEEISEEEYKAYCLKYNFITQ